MTVPLDFQGPQYRWPPDFLGGKAVIMELLQALADARLPLDFSDDRVRQELRDLHDAGHIICSFQPSKAGLAPAVRVHMVTPLGHQMLKHFGPDVTVDSPHSAVDAARLHDT
jgi:hypothetical protein